MAVTYENALPPGKRIDGIQPGQYEILEVLGSGGFGITYKGFDHLLHAEVAIKEYLPVEIALRQADGSTVIPRSSQKAGDYQWGLERFLDEARILSRFKHAPNIVRVENFLQANGTAYIVMDYEPGESLESYLKRAGTLDEESLLHILLPVLDGLRSIHAENFYHRDIKPANIYLRKNGKPCLLDFGGARQALGERSRTVTSVVSLGYSPSEQYSAKAKLMPASDLYALGATLYRCITGKIPVESTERVNAEHEDRPDPHVPLSQSQPPGYSQTLIQTIDWMMQLKAKDRPESAQKVLDRLLAPELTRTAVKEPVNEARPSEPPREDPDRSPTLVPPKPIVKRQIKKSRILALIAVLLVIMAGVRFTRDALKESTPTTATSSAVGANRVAEEKNAAKERREEAEKRREAAEKRRAAAEALAGEFVDIPGGTFKIGCSPGDDSCYKDEHPVHTVSIKGFRIGKYEVTVGQFRRFVDAAGYQTDAERAGSCYAIGRFSLPENSGRNWKNPGFQQTDRHPVVCVTWNDVKVYVQWLSRQGIGHYRLPSESEWEYAARAGGSGRYSFGDRKATLCDYGNVADRAAKQRLASWKVAPCNDGALYTAVVGAYRPNRFGLYDMHGNVWEWTEDCWHDRYTGAPDNGAAWTTGGDCDVRVLRGGSWLDGSRGVRSSYRGRTWSGDPFSNVSFRLVQDF